jgi:hypothetical protein
VEYSWLPSYNGYLDTEEICLEAVKHDGSALEYVPEALKTQELCLSALKNDFSVWTMRYIPENAY